MSFIQEIVLFVTTNKITLKPPRNAIIFVTSGKGLAACSKTLRLNRTARHFSRNNRMKEPQMRKYTKRKLVFGVGDNDANYVTHPKIKGKQIVCPFYMSWHSMLHRSYNSKFHIIQPTYREVTVCNGWHSFMTFRAWMEKQNWKGKQLDKDIVSPGNKIYSPDKCVFVSKELNSLLLHCGCKRRKYPIGATLHSNGKFLSQCNINGKNTYLGCFLTAKEASTSYRKFKSTHILKIANEQPDPRIANGLRKHAELIKNGEVV